MSIRQRERGFSLLEVTIASALGFIVLAVAVQLLLSAQHNLRLANAHARLNENARAAVELLRAEIRGAGALPCAPGALDSLLSDPSPPELVAIGPSEGPVPLRGDLLTVNRFQRLPVDVTPSSGSVTVAATAGGGDCVIFQSPGDPTAHPVLDEPSVLAVPETTRFYLDQSVGQAGLSSLYRARTSRGGQREELVEGVVDFRVAFAVLDEFVSAAEVEDWAAVSAVRLWLLISSGGHPTGLSAPMQNLVWPDGDPVTFDGQPMAPDRRLYQVFATAVAIEGQSP